MVAGVREEAARAVLGHEHGRGGEAREEDDRVVLDPGCLLEALYQDYGNGLSPAYQNSLGRS